MIVQRIEFQLGGRLINGYSAGQIDPETRSPLNYLSGQQLAEVIGIGHKTTVLKYMPQELINFLGIGFTTVPAKVQTTQKNYIKVNLWSTESAVKFLQYHAFKGNKVAQEIVGALATTTLDIIINDAFNREYERYQAEEWTNARAQGILTRNRLTDAIQHFLFTYPEKLSENQRKYVYIHCTDAIYKVVFDRNTAKLKRDWRVDDVRANMTTEELKYVEYCEYTAAQILNNGKGEVLPLDAVRIAGEMISSMGLVPKVTR